MVSSSEAPFFRFASPSNKYFGKGNMIFCNHIDPPEENLPHPFSMVHPMIHPVFGAQLVCHVNLSHDIVAIINSVELQTINFQQRPSLF